MCNVIIKLGSSVQPIAWDLDLEIGIEKLPSASTNPVTQYGFNLASGALLKLAEFE
jgi:hypothetical protein